MVIALENRWIWDSWYAYDGETWHAFFLQADNSLKKPELRHWHATHGHATSTDLVNWQHLGTCFGPAKGPAWDDYTIWTGSVVQDDAGLWHLFYTGASRAEHGLKQRIGHAVSTDLHTWRRVGDGLCLDLSGNDYEEYTPGHWHDRAMRDPWVMRDPDGPGWLMFFTARAPDIADANAAGAIGFATSANLHTWTLRPPVFVGGFGQLEVPQVFEIDGAWYCLFCTSHNHWSADYKRAAPGTPVTGTHYLMANNPRGPWQIAPGAFLDGSLPCRRYASRILNTDTGLKILGFALEAESGGFVGHVMDPEPVTVDENGILRVVKQARSAA